MLSPSAEGVLEFDDAAGGARIPVSFCVAKGDVGGLVAVDGFGDEEGFGTGLL